MSVAMGDTLVVDCVPLRLRDEPAIGWVSAIVKAVSTADRIPTDGVCWRESLLVTLRGVLNPRGDFLGVSRIGGSGSATKPDADQNSSLNEPALASSKGSRSMVLTTEARLIGGLVSCGSK